MPDEKAATRCGIAIASWIIAGIVMIFIFLDWPINFIVFLSVAVGLSCLVCICCFGINKWASPDEEDEDKPEGLDPEENIPMAEPARLGGFSSRSGLDERMTNLEDFSESFNEPQSGNPGYRQSYPSAPAAAVPSAGYLPASYHSGNLRPGYNHGSNSNAGISGSDYNSGKPHSGYNPENPSSGYNPANPSSGFNHDHSLSNNPDYNTEFNRQSNRNPPYPEGPPRFPYYPPGQGGESSMEPNQGYGYNIQPPADEPTAPPPSYSSLGYD